MARPTANSATVITVSDSCFAGAREDISGPSVAARLRELGYKVSSSTICPDDVDVLVDALRVAAVRFRLVVTTGGTGIGPRDVTPEATRVICTKLLDGIPELMRSAGLNQTPFAPLSRALCGTAAHALILNLPGRPDGALASLNAVAHLLPHALEILSGHTEHINHPAVEAAATEQAKAVSAKSQPARLQSGK
jgi:molybdenum cofactor synthesis domain-containing protein